MRQDESLAECTFEQCVKSGSWLLAFDPSKHLSAPDELLSYLPPILWPGCFPTCRQHPVALSPQPFALHCCRPPLPPPLCVLPEAAQRFHEVLAVVPHRQHSCCASKQASKQASKALAESRAATTRGESSKGRRGEDACGEDMIKIKGYASRVIRTRLYASMHQQGWCASFACIAQSIPRKRARWRHANNKKERKRRITPCCSGGEHPRLYAQGHSPWSYFPRRRHR
jgi:hypothetical protein